MWEWFVDDLLALALQLCILIGYSFLQLTLLQKDISSMRGEAYIYHMVEEQLFRTQELHWFS